MENRKDLSYTEVGGTKWRKNRLVKQ